MKKYTHDYTLPGQALETLTRTSELLRKDGLTTASGYVDGARNILDEYLSQDNMVEDDDCWPGWIDERDLEQSKNCFYDLDHFDAAQILFVMECYVADMLRSGFPAETLTRCRTIIDKLSVNL